MTSEKQASNQLNPQNLRLRRMFQTDPTDQQVKETEAWMEEDLKGIVVRFEQPEEKPLSLIDVLNHWMERANTTPTQSLLNYIEELRAQYAIEDLDEGSEEEEVDIESLIKQSEAEILQEEDQKTLLYSLIQDISKSDERPKSKSDLSFEENLQKLFEEEDEGKANNENPVVTTAHDIEEERVDEIEERENETEEVEEESVREENEEEFHEKNIVAVIDEEDYFEDVQFITQQEAQIERKKTETNRRKMSPLVKLLLVFLLVIGFLFYLVYQDQIHSLFKQWFDTIRKIV